MSRPSAIDGAEWCERWRSDDRRPASAKDTQPEEYGGCARGAGLLCKQTMVGSLPTFSTTRESHDSNAARSTVQTGRRSAATGGNSRDQGEAAGRTGTCIQQSRKGGD